MYAFGFRLEVAQQEPPNNMRLNMPLRCKAKEMGQVERPGMKDKKNPSAPKIATYILKPITSLSRVQDDMSPESMSAWGRKKKTPPQKKKEKERKEKKKR